MRRDADFLFILYCSLASKWNTRCWQRPVEHRRPSGLTKPRARSSVVTWICEKIAQSSGLERTNDVCWTVPHPVYPSSNVPFSLSLSLYRIVTSMRWLFLSDFSSDTLWFSPHLHPSGSQDRPLLRDFNAKLIHFPPIVNFWQEK